MSIRAPKVADLFVVKDDPLSQAAIRLLEHKKVHFDLIVVTREDYLEPTRTVPKLMTDTGMYIGMDSIKRIVDHELVG